MPTLESPPKAPVKPSATSAPPRSAEENLLVDLDGASVASAAAKTPLFHRPSFIVGAAAVLAVAILYSGTTFFHALTHESTDDAFIDAHIVSVAPKISGRVSAVEVRDNELVHKGDLLLEIDARDVSAMVAQRAAALDVAKAHLENAQMSAEQAEAHVNTLLAAYASAKATTAATAADAAKVQGDLQRARGLIESGAISQQEFAHSQADTTSSQATLDSKKKQLQAAEAFAQEGRKQAGSARAQVGAAKAEVAQAQAELQQAELQKSYTKITAPETGRVTNKSVEAGNYVQVGQPLFAIVPPQVWVTANFKETQLTEMRVGQPAEVAVDAYPDRALRGHVESIQAGSGARFSLLPPENATGNFVKVVQRVPVKIVLDEQPGVQQILGPGMSAVPDVKVSGGFGPLLEVLIICGLALLVLLGATIWWLRRVRSQIR